MWGVKLGLCLPRSRMATIEASLPTTRSLASMTSHFFSTFAVLVEWVLPNMDRPFDFRRRASSRASAGMSTVKRRTAKKTTESIMRYHGVADLACSFAAFEPVGVLIMPEQLHAALESNSPRRMGDHFALSVGIDRRFANRESFAELDQFRLADQIHRRGLAEEIDRGAGGDRMRTGPISFKIANRARRRNAEHRRAGDRAARPQVPGVILRRSVAVIGRSLRGEDRRSPRTPGNLDEVCSQFVDRERTRSDGFVHPPILKLQAEAKARFTHR